jgi:hypothetical protein
MLILLLWSWPTQAQTPLLINGNRTLAGWLNAVTTAGTPNTYTATLDKLTAYRPQMCLTATFHAANTGSATLNVNGNGALPIQKWAGGSLVNLASGDVRAGQVVELCYDTTRWQALTVPSSLSSTSWGSIGGTLSDQADLQAALNAKQNSLGFTPVTNARTLDINGTANEIEVDLAGPLDLTANRAWQVGIPSNAQLSIAKLLNLTTNGVVTTSGSDGTLGVSTQVLTQSGLTWNVAPTTCSSDANGGKLTVVGSQIVCASDIGGEGTPATAFSALTAGTNTTAAMVVGSGASLATTGTGTITATRLTSTAPGLVEVDGSGIPSLAEAADVVAIFGGGTCTGYLKSDGTCDTPEGTGTVNSGTAGHLAYYATSTAAVSDAGIVAATLVNPNVVYAHTQAGANAGAQIAAAIAALPATGGLVDATAFTNPQTIGTAITIPPGVTVRLGPIFYTVTATITVQQGGRLLGAGTNSPGSTILKAGNALNAPVVKAINSAGEASWWHHGEVRNLRVDGNKSQQTSGNAVEVYGLAETSLLQRLVILDAKQADLYIKGSQSGTGTVQNVSVNSADAYGVQLDDFRSGISLTGVGGDSNAVTFGVTNPSTGGGSILLVDPKSENATGPVVRITGGPSRVTLSIVGGNFLNTVSSAAIEIAADVATDPRIQILGLVTGNQMATLISDLKRSQTISTSAAAYHSLVLYTEGKLTRFDATGLDADLTANSLTLADLNAAVSDANLLSDPGSNGLVNRTGATTTSAVTDSTVGRVLRVTGDNTFAFGALNLADADAVINDLPLANLAPAASASLLLGRGSAAGGGDWEPLTIGSGLSLLGTTLSATGTGSPLTVQESDGDPSVPNVTTIRVSPDTLVNNGGGTVTLTTGGGPGGGVGVSGTPTLGQAAEWVNATTIQGVNVSGTGNYAKTTNPVFTTPNLGTPSALTLTNATGLPTTGLLDNAVSYAKLQNVSAASRLLGRGSAAGAGDPEEITLAGLLTMSGTQLTVSGTLAALNTAITDADLVAKSGTPVANQLGIWTGDGILAGQTVLTLDTTTRVLTLGVPGTTSGTLRLGNAASTNTVSLVPSSSDLGNTTLTVPGLTGTLAVTGTLIDGRCVEIQSGRLVPSTQACNVFTDVRLPPRTVSLDTTSVPGHGRLVGPETADWIAHTDVPAGTIMDCPTGSAIDNEPINFKLRSTVAGGVAISWAACYVETASLTLPTQLTGSGAFDLVKFLKDDASNTWVLAAKATQGSTEPTATFGIKASDDQPPLSQVDTLVVPATSLSIQGDTATLDLPTWTGAGTLTNKRVAPRVRVQTSVTTLTPNFDLYDQEVLTAQATAPLTIAAPTYATARDGELRLLTIKDTGITRTITWTGGTGGFVAEHALTFPTGTPAGQWMTLQVRYNASTAHWSLVGSTLPPASGASTVVRSTFIPAGAFDVHGNCQVNEAVTLVTNGPTLSAVTCTDSTSDSVETWLQMPGGWNGGTVTITLIAFSVGNNAAEIFEMSWIGQCVSSGDSPAAWAAVNHSTDPATSITWGSSTARQQMATSGALTPSGSCAAGDSLYLKGEVDASASTMTPFTDLRILGIRVEYTRTTGDD